MTWKIFAAKSGICVRFSIDAEYLWQTFKETAKVKNGSVSSPGFCCYGGNVDYENDANVQSFFSSASVTESIDADGREFAKTLFLKRDSFKHEREFRLIHFEPNHEFAEENSLYEFEIDTSKLGDVLIGSSKGVDEKLFSTIEKTIKKFGYQEDVTRSTYYEFPKINGIV